MGVPPQSEADWGKTVRTLLFWAILIVGTIALVQFASDRRRKVLDISYNQFLKELEQHNVAEVQVTDGRRVQGAFQTVVTAGSRASKNFATILPFESTDAWVSDLIAKGVEVRGGEEKQSLLVLVLTFLPYLLILALVLFMLRQMQARNRDKQ